MSPAFYQRLVQLADSALPRGLADALRRCVRDRRSERQRREKAERTAWWDAQRGSGGSFVAEVAPGIRMRLHFDDALCRMIHLDEFEAEELIFLRRFLRPGDTMADIGANIGLFSLHAARAVGEGGRVFAFEPSAPTHARLCENVEMNGWQHVRTCALALSDEAGTRELLAATDGKDAWNSFAQPYVGGEFVGERVETTTWDAFAAQHDLAGRVAFMKIDVEGWESHVLAGAVQTLSRADAPVLQVEFTEDAARNAGSSGAALYRQIAALGYTLHRWDPWAGTLTPEPLRESYPYMNLFATKDLAATMRRLAGV